MAYIIGKRKNDNNFDKILPLFNKLNNGQEVILDKYIDQDFQDLKRILNKIISDYIAYPQEKELNDEEFAAYYLSHDVFVLKEKNSNNENKQNIIGAFYIKPNYPGRCDDFCNGGFIVDDQFRGLGAGKLLGKQYLHLAKQLGYRASIFNLVFANNIPAVKLWKSLGFQQLSIIPQVGRLKEGGYVDAIQFYYDLTQEIPFKEILNQNL